MKSDGMNEHFWPILFFFCCAIILGLDVGVIKDLWSGAKVEKIIPPIFELTSKSNH